MQEQEFNNQAQAIISDSEPELFENYEIKGWKFTPRLYKIIAASVIFNLLALVIIAEGNLLERRACNNPFFGRVCQVLDTVYVGSMIFGTDSEFVSKDYEKTELADAEITYVDVTGDDPPFKYPEGYFQIANQDQYAVIDQQYVNGDFPYLPPPTNINPTMPNSGSDLITTPQVLPTPNNDITNQPLPDLPYSVGKMPTVRTPRVRQPRKPKVGNDSPKELPKLDGDETAKTEDTKEEKQPESKQPEIKSDAVAEIEINKKPFEDLGDFVNAKLANKELDLNQHFEVVLDGTITADGKFDRNKSRFGEAKGDKEMVEVARKAIEAIGNSGFLAYLKNSGVDRVKLTLIQDDKQISVVVISEQKTPERAGTVASGFNTLLSGVKFADANGLKKLDENSKTLVNNAKVTSQGKNFVLNFAIPKPMAQDLIRKSLNERAEKKNNQPNGSGEIRNNSNSKSD